MLTEGCWQAWRVRTLTPVCNQRVDLSLLFDVQVRLGGCKQQVTVVKAMQAPLALLTGKSVPPV